MSNKITLPFLRAPRLLLMHSHADKRPLWEVLLKEKIITLSQLQEALERQEGTQDKLGKVIVDLGFAREEVVVQVINTYYGTSITSLSENLEELVNKRQATLKGRLSNLRIPIRVKLSIAITFIIWITILILSFIILARQKEQLYLQTVKTGKVSLNYFANNARIPLFNDGIVRLTTLIREASSVEELLYAIIVAREQVIKAHTDNEKIGTTIQISDHSQKWLSEGENITYFTNTLPSGTHVLNFSRPVTFQNKELGTVHVGISLDFIKKQISKESIFILVLSLLIVILGIAISILVGYSFSRPISQLVLATKEISRIRKDELGDLAKAFN